jgi:hypothetical protein
MREIKTCVHGRIGDQLVRVGGRLIPALIGKLELSRLIARNMAAGSSVTLSFRNDTLQVNKHAPTVCHMMMLLPLCSLVCCV